MVNLQKYAHTYDRPILKVVPMYTRQCFPMCVPKLYFSLEAKLVK